MNKQFLSVCIGLLMSLCSFAQTDKQAHFKLKVAYDTVGLGEVFQVTYTIENAKAIEQFVTPSFEGFTLVAGPMMGQSTTIINGEMSQSSSYTYHLQPTELGAYNLLATSVETEQGTLMTEDVAVVVVEKVTRPAPPSFFGNSPFGNDPFFNGGGFGSDIFGGDMDKRMKEMEERMNRVFGEKVQPPLNEAPSKKENKSKGKVYKI